MSDVLVVDDEAAIRQIVRMVLERDGHTVAEAINGDDALRYLATHQPDIVVTDMYMPGLDGLALTRALRRTSHSPAIIAMSGSGEPHTLEMAERLGARVTLTKPFTAAGLLAAVAEVTGGPASQAP